MGNSNSSYGQQPVPAQQRRPPGGGAAPSQPGGYTYLTPEQIQGLLLGGFRPDLFAPNGVHPSMIPPMPAPRYV